MIAHWFPGFKLAYQHLEALNKKSSPEAVTVAFIHCALNLSVVLLFGILEKGGGG